MNVVKTSKFLSLVLRHAPEKIGLTLDKAGWASVSDLLNGMRNEGIPLTMSQLQDVVKDNNKKRFEFSPDKKFIRASQGHSVEVDLQYQPAVPPDVLYHGTAERFASSIMASGLTKQSRHHVHLSADTNTAFSVGQRHGKPVIFKVNAKEMAADGYQFFQSTNGVWLTDSVPTQYLDIVKRI
jgi:putative RNA 2'-phosphotransferase